MRDRGMQDPGAPNLRGLKALVIGLGILIVLGTALVIGVAVKRVLESTGGPAPQAATSSVPAPGPAGTPFRIALPGGTGASVAGVAAADGLVAVWVRDDAGGRVVFIDPRTGRIAGTAAPGH